jgi:hypothetical protein
MGTGLYILSGHYHSSKKKTNTLTSLSLEKFTVESTFSEIEGNNRESLALHLYHSKPAEASILVTPFFICKDSSTELLPVSKSSL